MATTGSTLHGLVVDAPAELPADSGDRAVRIAVLGNPNTGKTTLFNRLTGLRHKTANFPGTTLDARTGRFHVTPPLAPPLSSGPPIAAPAIASDPVAAPAASLSAATSAASAAPPAPSTAVAGGGTLVELIDLPGVYSLELDQIESRVAREALEGHARVLGGRAPDALLVVADGTNLARALRLAGEALRRRLPTVVAVNMIDLARQRGLKIDADLLAKRLGCRVVLVSARTGEGLEALRHACATARVPTFTPPGDDLALYAWADETFAEAAAGSTSDEADRFTDRLDRLFTHPVLGIGAFGAIMLGLFYLIFSLAHVPMGLIDHVFGVAADWVKHTPLPDGAVKDLLSDGVMRGIGATVIFLPQIMILIFVITLLEDTGYLARAALLMDRLLRPFGLPGHSFVPLLSGHACALPALMACRAVPDPKERLATILAAPFMSCTARIPVYVLLTVLLFPDSPTKQAAAFIGCYLLGIAAGVLSAMIARRTILRGRSRPMAIELPSYKWPSLRTALVTTGERAWLFLKNAGSVIVCICVVLWWLGAYPKVEAPDSAVALRAQAAALVAPANSSEDDRKKLDAQREELSSQADAMEHAHAKSRSFMGRIGQTVQPVFAPLGYDWQISVGVMASFAAREVFVSTMSVVTTGNEREADDPGVLADLKEARRTDSAGGAGAGARLFDAPTSWSLLVFFVLAMQCLPTLAVTMRESGHIKWAVLQFVWMSTVAYTFALIAFNVARAMGG